MKKTGEIYYPRLESEIVQRGLLKKDIINLLGIDRTSFTNKLNGKKQFKLDEGLLIWETWFSDIPINELFDHETR